MNAIKCTIVSVLSVVALVAATLSAQAAYSIIYRVSGITNYSGAIATAIHCTNLNADSQRVKVTVYDYDGAVKGTASLRIRSGKTRTFVTSPIALYAGQSNLATGQVWTGYATILSTRGQMVCSVVVLDPNNAVPGFATDLHMVRYPRGGGGEE